jgi:hypothetical protein
MPGRCGLPGAAQGHALGLVAVLALGGTALLFVGGATLAETVPDTLPSVEGAPGVECNACTLRHKALLKRRKPTEQCRIKGKIGDAGERIYHLPGGGRYERTDIDPAKGERWFCTEAEARAAGWKAGRE